MRNNSAFILLFLFPAIGWGNWEYLWETRKLNTDSETLRNGKVYKRFGQVNGMVLFFGFFILLNLSNNEVIDGTPVSGIVYGAGTFFFLAFITLILAFFFSFLPMLLGSSKEKSAYKKAQQDEMKKIEKNSSL